MSNIPVALTETELRALLTVARSQDYRAYVLFLVSVTHGLRVSEAIALRKRDFEQSGSNLFLRVARLKGSNETVQRIFSHSDPLLDEFRVITDYIAEMQPTSLLFRGDNGEQLNRRQVNRFIERFGRLAGLPAHKLHSHVLRHTVAIMMRQRGVGLEVIQSALGHKNLSSTGQYLRVSSDEADDARQQAFATSALAASAK